MNQADVTTRARKGVVALLGRQVFLFPFGFVTSVILARLLAPVEFGTYASATFVVMGAGVLLELGLGSIVIQQPEEPTTLQLRSIFTAQVLIFGTAMALLMLLAPYAAEALHLPAGAAWMIRAISLHMVLGCFGTNSTLLLERRMGFDSFARIDIINLLFERGLTLSLAFTHFGAWSFVIGSLAAMTLRVGMLLAAAPWSVGLAFDRALLSRALRFGLAIQGNNLLMLVRDNLNTLLGGGLFGPKSVGYLNWGQNLPQTCSNWLVQIVARISFPAFARLHEEPEERTRFLTTSLRALNLVTYPMLVTLLPLGTHLVTFVYSESWRPALFALDCFAIRALSTNVTSVIMGYLNATGRAGLYLRVAILWTVGEIGLAVALVPGFGFNGVAIAYAVGPVLPAIALIALIRHDAPIPLLRTFGVPLLAAAVAGGLGYLATWSVTSLPALVAALLLSGGGALAVIAVVERALLASALQGVEARLKRAFQDA